MLTLGSVISPILYAVFINDLITEIDNSGLGITVLNYHIPGLLFCDDIILLANDDNKLIKLLKICENHSIKWNYRFNTDKCNIITHNYNHPFDEIITNQNKLRNQFIQNEFLDQLPISHKNTNQNHLVAPVIIIKYYPNKNKMKGYDS